MVCDVRIFKPSVNRRWSSLIDHVLSLMSALLVGRPTIGLPSVFSTKLSHVQWGIPQKPSFHHVEHGGFVQYLSEWCHRFYAQAYRPTHRSR